MAEITKEDLTQERETICDEIKELIGDTEDDELELIFSIVVDSFRILLNKLEDK